MNAIDIAARVRTRPLRRRHGLLILLLALAGAAQGAPVYKCIAPGAPVAYQDTPGAETQRAQPVELAPEPAWQPSPQYAVANAEPSPARAGRHATPHGRARGSDLSFECRAADGQVFYRHSGCPRSVAAAAAGSAHARGTRSGGTRASNASSSLPVSASRIARSDACREIERAGAIGRSGHENDERVTTYERDLGRDPCREN